MIDLRNNGGGSVQEALSILNIFIPKNTELLREENLKKIEAHLTEAVRLSASCGLSREELREMLELLWEG